MFTAHGVVLHADDSADDRLFMAEAFKRSGIADRLVQVDDGQGVVDYFSGAGAFAGKERALVGLILLDLKMPGKGGFETLEWVRGSEAARMVPVTILSASTLPADVERAYRLGACGYIAKPSTYEELCEWVESLRVFLLRFAEFPEDRPR